MKYTILIAITSFILLNVVSATVPLKGYDRVTSKAEINSLEILVQDGALAALELAAIDEVLPEHAQQRYQVNQVKYVSKQIREVDNVVSYFVMVSLIDTEDVNAKGTLGYVVDKANDTEKLTLRAYKVSVN